MNLFQDLPLSKADGGEGLGTRLRVIEGSFFFFTIYDVMNTSSTTYCTAI